MNRIGRIFVAVLVIVVGLGVIHHHRQSQARSEPAPGPVAGASAFTPGDYGGSIVTADGRTRTYILHVPAGYSATRAYPLVLVFHGGMGTGSRVQKSTNFNAKADAKGFIVVYPDGIGHNWNDGRGTANPTIDDVGFVRQLIANLKTRLPIDANRIYATGVSNGAHFAQRLGCDLADELAAIGSDIGAMPTNLRPRCHPARPIAVVGIQGAADPISPLNGGEVASLAAIGIGRGGLVESATATMNFWGSVNGCDPTPTLVREPPRVNDGTSVDRYTFSGCKPDAPVVYYIVQGMGHAWPPHSQPLPQITGPTSNNINATDVMWDFFSSVSR